MRRVSSVGSSDQGGTRAVARLDRRRWFLWAVLLCGFVFVPADAVLAAMKLCVSPTGSAPQSVCVNQEFSITWTAEVCGEPPSYNGTECTLQKRPIQWSSGPTLQYKFTSTGIKTLTPPTATQGIYFTKTPPTASCPGDFTIDSSGSASVTVIVKGLSQFNAKPDRFPKCRGEAISREDFTIVTDPTGYEDEVVVTGLSTDPRNADGTPKTGSVTLTAWATMCGKSLPAQYGIPGDNLTEKCQVVPSRPYNAVFSNVMEESPHTGNEYGFTFSRTWKSGTVSGTSTPTMKGQTEWTSCGGAIAQGQEKHWDAQFSAGVEWAAIKDVLTVSGGGSYSWGGSKSVEFSHEGIPNKQIKQQAWAHPITLTVSGTITSVQECAFSLLTGLKCNPVKPVNTSYSEQENLELDPERALCVRCCS